MKSSESSQKDIIQHFKDKIEALKITMPPLGRSTGNSCAANMLNSVLEVLNFKDLETYYFNNLAIPFSGFGSYKTQSGWKGPCGVVSGAIAAIGIILGGQERIQPKDVPIVFTKALVFSTKFEKRFGSLSCEDLCGYDLSKNYQEYVKNGIWEKKCCDFIYFAIEQISKIMRKELKEKWK